MRSFLQISENKASKTNVSCEASSKFHRTKLPNRTFRARLPPNFREQSFQNERFARGFLQISENKASKSNVSCQASSKFQRTKFPKRTFRARLLQIFIEQSFQNERFVRGFLKFSENKASKSNVSCEASSKFQRTKFPKRTFRARLPQIFIEQSFQNERFARSFRQFP